ncbi:Transcriptional regulator [gamma proteobacterium HdN1]|nr:Transcriptional regulator [gamma proteobacterium HdN1]
MARKPIQQRSKATVEAIVEAGIICVAKRGIEGTTTRHIAAVAGIGIGSLYEYFENKEEIYQVMADRMVEDVVNAVRGKLPDLLTLTIRDAVRVILLATGELLQANDRRYLRCTRFVLQAGIKMEIQPLKELMIEIISRYMVQQPEYLKIKNLGVMNYIFIHGGMFTLLRYLSEDEPSISYEALMDGLTDMVGHYVEFELALLEKQSAIEKQPAIEKQSVTEKPPLSEKPQARGDS